MFVGFLPMKEIWIKFSKEEYQALNYYLTQLRKLDLPKNAQMEISLILEEIEKILLAK